MRQQSHPRCRDSRQSRGLSPRSAMNGMKSPFFSTFGRNTIPRPSPGAYGLGRVGVMIMSCWRSASARENGPFQPRQPDTRRRSRCMSPGGRPKTRYSPRSLVVRLECRVFQRRAHVDVRNRITVLVNDSPGDHAGRRHGDHEIADRLTGSDRHRPAGGADERIMLGEEPIRSGGNGRERRNVRARRYP